MIEVHIQPERASSRVSSITEYDHDLYHERLEAVLAETPVSAVQAHPFVTVSPHVSVRSAVSLLADRHIACLIVAEEGELRGIFTERDVLNKVADSLDQMLDLPVSAVMTANPMYLMESDSTAAALCVMAAFGYRHVPVLDADRQVVGVVSPQRVLHFLRRQWTD